MADWLQLIWRPAVFRAAVEIVILAVGIYYVLTLSAARGASIVTGFIVVMLTHWCSCE